MKEDQGEVAAKALLGCPESSSCAEMKIVNKQEFMAHKTRLKGSPVNVETPEDLSKVSQPRGEFISSLPPMSYSDRLPSALCFPSRALPLIVASTW